jgi:phenylacetate-CoA ligase
MAVVGQFSRLLQNFRNFKNFGEIRITGEADIQRIPFTTRADLAGLDIKKSPVKPAAIYCTSGTTGKNIMVAHSKEAQEQLAYVRAGRFFETIGLGKNDKILNLFGYGLTCAGSALEKGATKAGITIVPVGELTPGKLEMVKHIIRNAEPTIIFATANQIADIINNLDRGHSIRKCIATGEPLLPEFRKRIEENGITVYNCYGCNETGLISVQENPEEREMVLVDDGLYVEVIKEDGKTGRTGRGEIIITDLHNFSSPEACLAGLMPTPR